jgi:hypothetical protein
MRGSRRGKKREGGSVAHKRRHIYIYINKYIYIYIYIYIRGLTDHPSAIPPIFFTIFVADSIITDRVAYGVTG